MGQPSAKALMLSGELYDANDPELLAERAACRARCEQFNALPFADEAGRRAVLEQLLGAVAADAVVMGPVQFDYGTLTTIGPRTFINFGLIVLDAAPVTIGADVQIGPRVQLLTPLHPLDADRRREGWERGVAVTIEDDVWLAGGVIVCPGVTIGRAAVIGAGSVVTRDMPAEHLCVGNPCRPLRALSGTGEDG